MKEKKIFFEKPKKIVFEKLTIKEEEKVRGGDRPSSTECGGDNQQVKPAGQECK